MSRTVGSAGLPLRRTDRTSGRRGGRIPVVPLAIGVALGFAIRALAELFLLGRGGRTTFEEGVYPFSFVLAMAGGFMGRFLLLAAEQEVDQRRRPTSEEWRSITSARGERRGIRATPGILRALRTAAQERS